MSLIREHKTLTVKWDVMLPSRPAFLRQHGHSSLAPVPIEHVSDEGLRELGEAWTEALVQEARVKREKR